MSLAALGIGRLASGSTAVTAVKGLAVPRARPLSALPGPPQSRLLSPLAGPVRECSGGLHTRGGGERLRAPARGVGPHSCRQAQATQRAGPGSRHP